MKIRTASISDLSAVTEVEAECFPPAEAAGRASMEQRLKTYPDHFWVLEDEGKIVGFVNGMVTDEMHLSDDMYDDASLHDENGAWQMIFGVDTVPAYRKRGCASKLLTYVIGEAKKQNRRGLVLTCKDALVQFYAKFGFVDEGMSESVHGGVPWHEMRLTFILKGMELCPGGL
ncbi:MAG: GNAT family N-acetyltransferase [Lachnospiraceae bacterium]|nr:GNAT family N-acetyltransferase [Lachnospiraceae bacterium]